MSLKVKSFASNKNVWVAYALQDCNVHAYTFFEENADGTLSELSSLEQNFALQNFFQGSENIIGNNSVTHNYLDGEVLLLPFSSGKSFSITSDTTPPDYRLRDYYVQHIGIPGSTSGEANSHYEMSYTDTWNWNHKVHSSFRRDYSLLSVVETLKQLPDDYRGASTTVRSYHVEFPSFKRSDIIYQSSYGYFYSDKTALAITKSSDGTVIDRTNAFVGFVNFGTLRSSKVDIAALCHSASSGSAVEPDDLLIRLTQEIGSLKVNNLANVAQLRKLYQILPPKIRTKSKVFKTMAEFILWYKYSYKTTSMDIEEMFKYYFRAEPVIGNKGYSRRKTLTNKVDEFTTDTFTFYLGSYQQSILDQFGLQPNLENTWDLIPFSFVVDWFSGIGDMLASLDAVDEWLQVPLVAYVTSRKRISPYSMPTLPCAAISTVFLHSYVRTVSKTLPLPLVTPSLNMPHGHSLEAVSLILANKK